MSFHGAVRGLLLICMLCLGIAGCAQKIAKPGPPQPGWSPPYAQGPILEQELQAVQANLKIVYFDYDNYTLTPQAQADLQYNAEILKRAPQAAVIAEGHCDERGTAEYNLALGDRRSKAVADYLVGLGVPPNRVSTVSYGSELPVDPGHNDAAWAKNRRAYLRVSK
jgi:peptidoglycan-associated lipoprotein